MKDTMFDVYIMTSKRNGTLYTGVTSDLVQRVWQHKSSETKGFTPKYKVNQLVYYEIQGDISWKLLNEKKIFKPGKGVGKFN